MDRDEFEQPISVRVHNFYANLTDEEFERLANAEFDEPTSDTPAVTAPEASGTDLDEEFAAGVAVLEAFDDDKDVEAELAHIDPYGIRKMTK